MKRILPGLLLLVAPWFLAAGPPRDGAILEKGKALEASPEGATVVPIVYASDGLRVHGYLARPTAAGKHPAVIVNRGGNRGFGAWSDEGAARSLGRLASWGYVVVASQYRGNVGGEGVDEFGGADVDDVLNLIPLLESLEDVDAGRIGMYGWSRGGMMTYLALARTDRIRAAVVGAGMADAFESTRSRPEMEEVFRELAPGYDEHEEESLRARSAVRWAETMCPTTPILILHGTGDWRVSPTQALEIAGKLLEAKHPYRLVMFEGGSHGLEEFPDEVRTLVRDWLDRYVRDGKSWPSLEPHGD